MTEYRYIIQDKDSSCLYLSENGPERKPKEFLQQLRDEGFEHAKEQKLGESLLRILTRDIPAGTTTAGVVRADPYTGIGQKHIS